MNLIQMNTRQNTTEPRASLPWLPAGYDMMTDASRGGLLPWSWAVERLRRAHNYWIGTVRPDGRPHAVPVWGCWLDNEFMFSTSRESVKAKNLVTNPHCVACPENAVEAIVLEGKVEEVTDRALIESYLNVYNAKYNWNQDVTQGPFFRVVPARVMAFVEEGNGSATRWTF